MKHLRAIIDRYHRRDAGGILLADGSRTLSSVFLRHAAGDIHYLIGLVKSLDSTLQDINSRIHGPYPVVSYLLDGVTHNVPNAYVVEPAGVLLPEFKPEPPHLNGTRPASAPAKDSGAA